MNCKEAVVAGASAITGGMIVALAMGQSSLATASPETSPQVRMQARNVIPSTNAAATRPVSGAQSHTYSFYSEPSSARYPASTVQSVVTHYVLPNNFGKVRPRSLFSPRCPASVPIPVGFGMWSSNYRNATGRHGDDLLGPVNKDGSATMWSNGGGGSGVLGFGYDSTPKDGPMDLYVAQLCAVAVGPTVIVK